MANANVHQLTRIICRPRNVIKMMIASIAMIQAAVEPRKIGLNGLNVMSHVVVVPEPVPNASFGRIDLKNVTMKVKIVMKMIVLPGPHGNHGVAVPPNAKYQTVMIRSDHDTGVGIQKMVMAKNVLVVKRIPAQEKFVAEMPMMFAIKNRRKLVTKMNVNLNVNGPNGVSGAIVLLHVKTVSESGDEKITKMKVPRVTVPALSQSDVIMSKPTNVLHALIFTKNVTRFRLVSAPISGTKHSWKDFAINIVGIVPNEEKDRFLIDFQNNPISLFLII